MTVEFKEMKSVCVFCGAQNAVAPNISDMARKLVTTWRWAGKQLVYGGGDWWPDGRVANGVLLKRR